MLRIVEKRGKAVFSPEEVTHSRCRVRRVLGRVIVLPNLTWTTGTGDAKSYPSQAEW